MFDNIFEKIIKEKIETIRVIGQAREDGSKEYVTFTSELSSPVDKFLVPEGGDVIYDEIIEDNLPSIFPRESTLKRE